MPQRIPATQNFQFTSIPLSGSGILYIVDVKTISPALAAYMNKVLGGLVYGRSNIKLKALKKKIKDFLLTKKGTTQEIGAIAEYFVHLFLCDQGLESQFLIKNLEDNSLKKGFDGLYLMGDDHWLCESKSGSAGSNGVCHGSKVREAYDGIKKKISGVEPNNPWENAMYHAKVVGAEESLVKKLTTLSDRFDEKKYVKIDKLNVIPCGTLYLDGNKGAPTVTEIKEKITKLVKHLKYKDIRVVCITKDSVAAFYTYLNA